MGHDLTGVHTVRNRRDVDRLQAEPADVRHVVVIGGGHIGLEAAVVLTKLGKSVVVRGKATSSGFSVVCLRGGRVIALDCVDATRDYVQAKPLIVNGASPPAHLLAEMSVPLKTLV